MHYLSTRDRTLHFTAAEAIKQGLSRDGGLFLPEMLPALSARQIKAMESMSYQERPWRLGACFGGLQPRRTARVCRCSLQPGKI